MITSDIDTYIKNTKIENPGSCIFPIHRKGRKMNTTFFVFLTTLVLGVNCAVIHLKDGDIKGVTTRTKEGRLFHKFLGIPYAKAPVNELRFQVTIFFISNKYGLIFLSNKIFISHIWLMKMFGKIPSLIFSQFEAILQNLLPFFKKR